MPVAIQELEARVDEIAGGDAEFRKTLLETIGARPDAATKFVNGFLGKADVTRKQQEIAEQKRQFDAQAAQHQEALQQAEADKAKIMRDLANSRISEATASTRLQNVKELYALSDEDIPTPQDVRQTVRTGQVVDSTPDIDEKLKSFKAELMSDIGKQLIPELSSMAALDAVWDDINHEHQELYGKRMTRAEKMDLLSEARKNNMSLENAWVDKFNVSGKRMEVHDKTLETTLRQKWDDEQRAHNSELALQGVKGKDRSPFQDEKDRSPIFRAKLEPPKDELVDANGKTANGAPPPIKRDEPRGAEKAAQMFLERKMNGQLGKPLEQARP